MSDGPIARTAKGTRPVYFDDPATDALLAIVVTLVGELSVTRERLDALERVLEADKGGVRAAVDAYRPDATAATERASARADYIDRVMRIVTMQLERPDTNGATASFKQTLEMLLAEVPPKR